MLIQSIAMFVDAKVGIRIDYTPTSLGTNQADPWPVCVTLENQVRLYLSEEKAEHLATKLLDLLEQASFHRTHIPPWE